MGISTPSMIVIAVSHPLSAKAGKQGHSIIAAAIECSGRLANMSSVLLEYGIEGIAKSILSFGHLVGLVLGLGTTLYLDGGCFLSIARKSWDGYRAFMSGALFKIATKFVMVGLGILWITGCGFVIHYKIFDPGKLANPKLLAKLACVTMLTVNGYFLHYLVLRRVARMSDCSEFVRTRTGPLCLFSGAVSSACWIGAFLLGSLPILNNVIAFQMFVSAWAVLVLILYLSARVAIGLSGRRGAQIETEALESRGARFSNATRARPTPVSAIPAIRDDRTPAALAPVFAANADRRH